ncbi:hypothetical protein NOF55_08450 [Rhizobiaceae bacterium BDR2-2]|uniref:Uncharacterized protein n=1 Tax=Ectorhizobium quercum TaxID=2965071 RepID=A0AAE3SVM4_9HYPH|nr:hypothetical protein [Ectorhizobium quercum]MCX8997134.1 hypothetical protein [Ectorhizobium quercum]
MEIADNRVDAHVFQIGRRTKPGVVMIGSSAATVFSRHAGQDGIRRQTGAPDFR